MPERIVLVGFMGSGKSTVGRLVARDLDWNFLDMDRAIEKRAGASIPQLFRERGEAFFRDEERRLAEETRSLHRHVIAAGGGAFAFPETRDALRNGAVTVWLRCALETLLARLRPDGSRPLAASRETIRHLFVEREPSYGMADWTVDASTAAPQELARRVLEVVFRARAQDVGENERR
jgi:shikimate kinase